MLQHCLVIMLLSTLGACGASGYQPAAYDPPLQAFERVSNDHPNGIRMSEGTVRDGKEEGSWTFWYDNTKKMSAGDYHMGKQVGPWTFWDESGQLESQGEYRAGLREGAWTFWSAPGVEDAQRSGVYRQGDRVGGS